MAGPFSSRDHCLNCGSRLGLFNKKLFCNRCLPGAGQPAAEPDDIPSEGYTTDDMIALEFLNECSVLPEELLEDTVARMRDGEVAYIVPWAIYVDVDGRMMIPSRCSIGKTSCGTRCARIKRQGNTILVERDSIKDHKWVPGQFSTFGLSLKNLFPVKLVRHV